ELARAGEIAIQLVRSRQLQDASLKDIAEQIAPMQSRLQELEAEKKALQGAGQEPADVAPAAATQQVVEGPACPACGAAVDVEHQFCKGCGVRLTWCTQCQTVTAAAARFCSNCGAAMD
ncbi:MAG: zinc ribbon domain-containing protein, partial [Armatimonadota bacterium]